MKNQVVLVPYSTLLTGYKIYPIALMLSKTYTDFFQSFAKAAVKTCLDSLPEERYYSLHNGLVFKLIIYFREWVLTLIKITAFLLEFVYDFNNEITNNH